MPAPLVAAAAPSLFNGFAGSFFAGAGKSIASGIAGSLFQDSGSSERTTGYHVQNAQNINQILQDKNLTAAQRKYLRNVDRFTYKRGRQAQLKDRKDQWVEHVRNSKRAGLNPLTTLGLSQGGGVPSGNGATAGLMPSPTMPGVRLPTLSKQNFIGEALADGVETAFNRVDAKAEAELATIKLETMREELKWVQNKNAGLTSKTNFGFKVPQIATTSADTTGQSPALSDPVTVMRNDGLTSSNPDAPVQPEEDLWAWARNGTLEENVWSMVKRNWDVEASPKDWFTVNPKRWGERSPRKPKSFKPR